MAKSMPRITSPLRQHLVTIPNCIREASGILINGKRIKSLLFSTDVALIPNSDADAVIAVYPFTPTLQITNAILSVAQRPVLVGVGGGTTSGPRVKEIALDAELHGALAVVVNAPTKTEFVQELQEHVDIPVVLTIVSLDEDLEERMLHSGADIINVSGGKNTVEIVKALRKIDANFPIIATGGPSEDTIRQVIQVGANAVTYTPPTSAEIFKEMMDRYRTNVKKEG